MSVTQTGSSQVPVWWEWSTLLHYSVCQWNGTKPYLLTKLQNICYKTTLKAKKLHSSVKIPSFQSSYQKGDCPNNNTAIHSAMLFLLFFLFSSIILFLTLAAKLVGRYAKFPHTLEKRNTRLAIFLSYEKSKQRNGYRLRIGEIRRKSPHVLYMPI